MRKAGPSRKDGVVILPRVRIILSVKFQTLRNGESRVLIENREDEIVMEVSEYQCK